MKIIWPLSAAVFALLCGCSTTALNEPGIGIGIEGLPHPEHHTIYINPLR